MKRSHAVVGVALFALSVLFSLWMRAHDYPLAGLAAVVLPPLLLLPFVLRGNMKAVFWSGVLGLFWFSHGVMLAYSSPAESGYAWAEIILAIVIVLASSWPGLAGRFKRKPK